MTNEKKYWKGIEELNQTASFQESLESEFPQSNSPVEDLLTDDQMNEASTGRRDFLKFLGFSVAAGTQCEHAATASLIDSHSMDVVLAHTGFVADRIFEPVVSRGIPLVVYLHGGDLREALNSKGWRKRL